MCRMMLSGLLFWPVAVLAGDPVAVPKVTASKLVEAFMTNEAFADESYSTREIEITGKVARIYKPDHGTANVGTGGDMYVLEFDVGDVGKGSKYDLSLLIFFKEKDRAELAKLRPGQSIGVRWKCSRRVIYQLSPPNPMKHYSEVELRNTRLILDRVE